MLPSPPLALSPCSSSCPLPLLLLLLPYRHQAGVFEVLLLRLAALFDSANDTMMFINGQLFKREPGIQV